MPRDDWTEGPAGESRLRDIPTRWSVLKGPPVEALDHLYRTYGAAIRSYIRGRLARGDFRPLAPAESEDLLQELFLELGRTRWLARPDPRRGPFRPYLVGRLVYYLRGVRRSRLERNDLPVVADPEPALAAAAVDDPLEEWFERTWEDAVVRECLGRLRERNEHWADAVERELRGDETPDATIGASLGMSVDAYRSMRRRAIDAFRVLYRTEEARLDGFGDPESSEAG